ncbi:sulfatase [Corallococcus sp. H22C18031201]|uniref:sulfatase-like hydrolase/transferase n=1 Tax=Citreicoccus inhibens TaxID=2849499 RepID=UPI000E71F666|nr:sulfatase-like hydrolase/transferase [Citreicoccus inhibens]MBU8895292.1 sulfatase-like hydrolase/transferase [Citreicoccus inhibens]RJS26184.1 sulfatase [Corallococcus sp. H22C18031201]
MSSTPSSPPNVLLLLVGQLQFPRFAYDEASKAHVGMARGIKEVMGFAPLSEGNAYVRHFPGFMALREHAVCFQRHTIASSACTPSRAALLTGHYGAMTGVTQSEGIFKEATDPAFPWLDPHGVPTLGDWFRAAGYSTHYFGAWHVSHPRHGSLQDWGFGDWELSQPEPQGASHGDLGVYRDIGFTDLAVTFLRRKAAGLGFGGNPQRARDEAGKPWLAVLSLMNPGDISGYPQQWNQALPGGMEPGQPRHIPPLGARTRPPPQGTLPVALNPEGLPLDCATLPPTLEESLDTKPRAQLDASYKVGLALATGGNGAGEARSPLPFQLSGNPRGWFLEYLRFYTFLQQLVDRQIARVMRCLKDSGLADNTLVVFCADHGEHGGAHRGMIQKWHSAYEEVIHVPFVVSSRRVNPGIAIEYRDAVTSHIDVVPTLLGLAGFDASARDRLARQIPHQTVQPLVGADLSPYLRGEVPSVTEPNGQSREAVLFVTDDMVTEPLPTPAQGIRMKFGSFLESVRRAASEAKAPIRPGVVTQPCHVQCVRAVDWKLVRYWDPKGNAEAEYELYYLPQDGIEAVNLVSWRGGEPVLEPSRIPAHWGLSADRALKALTGLREQLTYQLRTKLRA